MWLLLTALCLTAHCSLSTVQSYADCASGAAADLAKAVQRSSKPFVSLWWSVNRFALDFNAESDFATALQLASIYFSLNAYVLCQRFGAPNTSATLILVPLCLSAPVPLCPCAGVVQAVLVGLCALAPRLRDERARPPPRYVVHASLRRCVAVSLCRWCVDGVAWAVACVLIITDGGAWQSITTKCGAAFGAIATRRELNPEQLSFILDHFDALYVTPDA